MTYLSTFDNLSVMQFVSPGLGDILSGQALSQESLLTIIFDVCLCVAKENGIREEGIARKKIAVGCALCCPKLHTRRSEEERCV